MSKWTFILFCVVVVVSASEPEWWEVNIAQGPVRAQLQPDEELYVFYNIPYATAPTGDHKFKAPLQPPTWTEPYEAIDKGIVCPQYKNTPHMFERLKVQEDCLIANVYVPDTKKNNLSVLVYVHGGAFQVGFGDLLTPKKLLKLKDIIVVTFNYRLGIHGFLCLGTDDIPGNAGMKDQIALLRWIQQNIAAFGGNPDDVTIAGYSAGSAAVDLLMVSKSAEGLFHKVIPESGANLAAFTVQSDPVYNAKEHAKTLNFNNTDDIYALEMFYKSLSYETLTEDAFLTRTDSTFLFSPCVERDTGDGAFLLESPLSILKRGNYKKVPLLYGFANMEGLFRVDLFDKGWKDRMNEKFSDFLPADLKFETDYEKEEVANKVKAFYFGDELVSNDNILRYVDYFSDVIFIFATLRAAKLHVEAGHNEVYLYEYSFVDNDVPVVPYTNVRGASHCAQTHAVLDGISLTNSSEETISEDFKSIKKTMREIWHNFVRTGKPVPESSSYPEWPPLGADGTPHMSLGQKLELGGLLRDEMWRFWNDIYKKFYREPLPPPIPPPKSRAEL